MLTPDELSSFGISQWSQYGDTFEGSDIFIGNGFSVNLHQQLSYASLFNKFSKECGPEVIRLFKTFGTTNFEYVIEALNNTQHVGTILGLDYSAITPIVESLKQGLIKTISDTHPGYKDVHPTIFRSLAVELKPFKDIFTTNYDVFLYKIILASNELLERGLLDVELFQDRFHVDLSTHKVGYGDNFLDCRKIYYLHGALFLYQDFNGTYKFRKAGEADEYIRLLRMEIANGNVPLFVAEGTASDKLNAINNNYYLRSCAEYLKFRNETNLVVYGSSFQPSDKHIVGWINLSKPGYLVTSIYTANRNEEELKIEMSRISNLFTSEVLFYDSTSLFTFGEKYTF